MPGGEEARPPDRGPLHPSNPPKALWNTIPEPTVALRGLPTLPLQTGRSSSAQSHLHTLEAPLLRMRVPCLSAAVGASGVRLSWRTEADSDLSAHSRPDSHAHRVWEAGELLVNNIRGPPRKPGRTAALPLGSEKPKPTHREMHQGTGVPKPLSV